MSNGNYTSATIYSNNRCSTNISAFKNREDNQFVKKGMVQLFKIFKARLNFPNPLTASTLLAVRDKSLLF